MSQQLERRDFLALLGIGGLVFASGLPGCGSAAMTASAPGGMPLGPTRKTEDFFFLQLSDTHWGFQGPPNPRAETTLECAVQTINSVGALPDFVVFTGDLTHTTDDATQRRERMKRFRDIVSKLRVKDVRFLPGEHDAAPDRGEAYREHFGDPTYAFDHKGVHFVAIDNASMPGGEIGTAQLAWLERDLALVADDTPIVVLAHRPLFPLFPDWEWQTKDGARAIDVLSRREHVTVFYGHIHQEHHFTTGRIDHHAARSLVFPLPAPGSVPKKQPLPWDAASPDHGLGWRQIALQAAAPHITEVPFRDRCEGPLPGYTSDVRPVLERRCYGCHANGGPATEEHDFSRLETLRAQRSRVAQNVAARAMPPRSSTPLTDPEVETLLRWAQCGTPGI
jgi:hypothetical protein